MTTAAPIAAPPLTRPSAITAYLTNRDRDPDDPRERYRAARELIALEKIRIAAVKELPHITKSSVWRRQALALKANETP